MTASVKIQPTGFSIQYPKTPWRVIFVEDAAGKFYFRLCGKDFRFEPRDRHRYPNYDVARRAAYCFLELMKRLERSRMKLNVLSEIGILKFPQENYYSYELWLLIDRDRYTWETLTANGYIRSPYWYKNPDTALIKGRAYIERELAVVQIMGLRHFLAPKGAEKLSGQGKEVDDLKTPETLVNTRFMPIRAESMALSGFEAIFASFFV